MMVKMRDMSIGTELMFLSMYRCGSDRGKIASARPLNQPQTLSSGLNVVNTLASKVRFSIIFIKFSLDNFCEDPYLVFLK